MIEMITNAIRIEVAESVGAAPKYKADVTLLKIEKAIIVEKGSIKGNPTVDLQLQGKDGSQYVVMATAGIIAMLGEFVRAKMVVSG